MLTDEIIAKIFNKNDDIIKLKNCAIFTDDPKKAELKIHEIYNKFNKEEIETFKNGKNQKELYLKNGWIYFWIKPNDERRCYRFDKAIIDKDVTFEQLYQIILPRSYTFNKNNIELF